MICGRIAALVAWVPASLLARRFLLWLCGGEGTAGDKQPSVVSTTQGRGGREIRSATDSVRCGETGCGFRSQRESAELGIFISFRFLTSYFTPRLMEEVGSSAGSELPFHSGLLVLCNQVGV